MAQELAHGAVEPLGKPDPRFPGRVVRPVVQLVDPPRESARVNPHHLVVRLWETLEFGGEVRPALAARQQKGHEQHDEPHRARDFVVVWARGREA